MEKWSILANETDSKTNSQKKAAWTNKLTKYNIHGDNKRDFKDLCKRFKLKAKKDVSGSTRIPAFVMPQKNLTICLKSS